MRSGSERMHTWRRTPSTGCNFQTLIIWILSLKRQVVMVQFLSIIFFSWISSIFVEFFESSRFFVSFCTNTKDNYTQLRAQEQQSHSVKNDVTHPSAITVGILLIILFFCTFFHLSMVFRRTCIELSKSSPSVFVL